MELIFTILEAIGMVLTVLGAFFMGRDTEKYPTTKLMSGMTFMSANIFMLAVAFYHNLLPMVVQMVLFFSSSALMIYSFTEEKEKVKRIFILLFSTLFVSLSLYLYNAELDYSMPPLIEILTAMIAVLGAYLLMSKDRDVELTAYMFFLIADIMYISIAYDNSMYFFMIQAIFVVGTSILAIRTNLSKRVVIEIF